MLCLLLHTGLCKISAGQGGTGSGCLRHWMDAWLICSCPLLSCCCCWENETSPASSSVMPAPLPASAQDSASLLVFPNERVSAKAGKPCRARTPLIAPHCPFLVALCQRPARLCSLLQLAGQGRALPPAGFRFAPGRPPLSLLRFARMGGAHGWVPGWVLGCPGAGRGCGGEIPYCGSGRAGGLPPSRMLVLGSVGRCGGCALGVPLSLIGNAMGSVGGGGGAAGSA